MSFGAGITVNSTTVNSATQLTTNVTIATTAAWGARDVTVTGPGTRWADDAEHRALPELGLHEPSTPPHPSRPAARLHDGMGTENSDGLLPKTGEYP